MLDPRIYRAAFVPVVFAIVVAAFSLAERPGPITTTLAPDAFDGAAAYRTMTTLAAAYPRRPAGSAADDAIAGRVAATLRANRFAVSQRFVSGEVAGGARTVRTVIGERVGFSNRRIVVVAHRDSVASPAVADLSGTATLLELARVLGGRTLGRTLVLVSTSGGPGGALGAADYARDPGGPVDGVIVLGDLASQRLRRPLVVPWGDSSALAAPRLRRTVEAALQAETGLESGGTHLQTQFARLAFPLALGEQGPFTGEGISAILLSASGERGPAANAPVSAARIAGFGRAVVRSVTALDGGRDVGPARAYLEVQDKLLPAWPVRLIVGALLLPVLAALIDGLARARRRREPILRWLLWVLAGIAPFAVAVLFVLALEATGLIHAPAVPVIGRAASRGSAAYAALASLALVFVLCWIGLRPLLIRLLGVRGDPSSPGAAVATLLVLAVAGVTTWAFNAYAAALLIPALHLWLVLCAPELRMRLRVALPLVLAGIVPPLLVALAYGLQFHAGPIELAWTGLESIAGGQVGALAALGWSVVLGCSASAIAIAVRNARARPPESAPVTVRGPVTYAGPGSLGGTESALRR